MQITDAMALALLVTRLSLVAISFNAAQAPLLACHDLQSDSLLAGNGCDAKGRYIHALGVDLQVSWHHSNDGGLHVHSTRLQPSHTLITSRQTQTAQTYRQLCFTKLTEYVCDKSFGLQHIGTYLQHIHDCA